MIRLFDDKNIDWKSIKEKHNNYFKKNCVHHLNNLINLDTHEDEFRKYLIEKVNKDELLVGTPDDLRVIRKDFLDFKTKGLRFTKSILKKGKKGKADTYEEVKTDFYNSLFEIFDYDTFRSNYQSSGKWGAYEYINELAVKTCSYCNRTYTITFDKSFELDSKDITGKIRPDLDHLFIQSRYPFFRISIFNLIPSCSDCNKGLKNSAIKKDHEDYLNPFSESLHEEYVFSDEFCGTVNSKEIDWNLFNEDSFYVTFKPREKDSIKTVKKRADINAELFLIENSYNCQREDLRKIIYHAYTLGNGRHKDTEEKVEELKITPDFIKRQTFGDVINDLTLVKRSPLSKFTIDIVKKYKII